MEDQPLWQKLVRSLKEDFPNAGRQGCPPSEVLHSLAFRRLKLTEAKPWLAHLGSCSACFNEFLVLKQEVRKRLRMKILAIAAALLLASVVLITWNRSHIERGSALQAAVLDLRKYSSLRDLANSSFSSERPLAAPGNAVAITLYLPLGSLEGKYELEIQSIDTQKTLLKNSGTALIKDHATILQTRLNLPDLPAGNYLLALRPQGMAWSQYRLVVR